MVRIKPLKKEDAPGKAKEILEQMEKRFGVIPNLFATIAHYPQALKPIIELRQAISKESTIEQKFQELANLVASYINHCHYCIVHHERLAKACGITEEQLNALKMRKLERVFSDKEKTVIEYARQVTQDAENTPDELYNRLKSYFSDSEIVNLTLIIGLINVFNRINGALSVELEKK